MMARPDLADTTYNCALRRTRVSTPTLSRALCVMRAEAANAEGSPALSQTNVEVEAQKALPGRRLTDVMMIRRGDALAEADELQAARDRVSALQDAVDSATGQLERAVLDGASR